MFYKIFKYFFNTTSTIFVIVIGILVFVNVGIVIASKVAPNLKVNVFAMLIVIFVTFAIMVTIEAAMFVFVGIRLILFVRKNSLPPSVELGDCVSTTTTSEMSETTKIE